MKVFRLFILAVLTSVSLSSCAELYSGLSNYNSLNGAQCERVGSNFSSYSKQEGKYLENRIIGINPENTELVQQEKSWVKNKLYYYASRSTFGTYSDISPYSGNSYKFYTYCNTYY